MQQKGLEKSAYFGLTQEIEMSKNELKFLVDVGVGRKVENWLVTLWFNGTGV